MPVISADVDCASVHVPVAASSDEEFDLTDIMATDGDGDDVVGTGGRGSGAETGASAAASAEADELVRFKYFLFLSADFLPYNNFSDLRHF